MELISIKIPQEILAIAKKNSEDSNGIRNVSQYIRSLIIKDNKAKNSKAENEETGN